MTEVNLRRCKDKSMEQKNNKYMSFFEQAKRLISLYIYDIKLTSAEKLTVLLSSIAIFAIILVFASLFIVFASMAIAGLLESVMAPFFAYMIVALFFLLCGVLFYAFRIEIIINPISRFLSGLFIAPPSDPSKVNQSTTKTDRQS